MHVTTMGLDVAKQVFQVHGVDAHGQVVVRKQLCRKEVVAYFTKLPACEIGMEAGSSSHYWARRLQGLGHRVKLMAPQFVRPYAIQPTMTFNECPKDLALLFVPGGGRGTAIMKDPEVVDFLHDRGSRAQYVTSVCTGSLLLGAAGLLQGYKATSHWTVRDLLPLLGATPVAQRVVEDRNRITAGGVTAGIDFGLQVAARLRDEQYAKMVQLMLEYDPQAPIPAGNLDGAGPELTSHVRARRVPAVEAARQATLVAQKRLSVT